MTVRGSELYRAFYAQRQAAKQRRVEWQLSFNEWLEVWQQSGRLVDRGRGRGKYCMGRVGDTGPYAVGNVNIIAYEQNSAEQEYSPERRRVKREQMLGNWRGFRRKIETEESVQGP